MLLSQGGGGVGGRTPISRGLYNQPPAEGSAGAQCQNLLLLKRSHGFWYALVLGSRPRRSRDFGICYLRMEVLVVEFCPPDERLAATGWCFDGWPMVTGYPSAVLVARCFVEVWVQWVRAIFLAVTTALYPPIPPSLSPWPCAPWHCCAPLVWTPANFTVLEQTACGADAVRQMFADKIDSSPLSLPSAEWQCSECVLHECDKAKGVRVWGGVRHAPILKPIRNGCQPAAGSTASGLAGLGQFRGIIWFQCE